MPLTALERRALLALRAVKTISSEAWGEWDNDNDHRVGKILKAMSGYSRRYRPDVDEIMATIQELEETDAQQPSDDALCGLCERFLDNAGACPKCGPMGGQS
jgi:hypothetical protein